MRIGSEPGEAGDDPGIDAQEPLERVTSEREDFDTPRTERTRETFAPDDRDTRFAPPAESTPLVEWEEPSPERERAPVTNNNRAAPSRTMSFGRGRRRDAGAGSAGTSDARERGESSTAPPAPAPAEERRVDVFAASPSPPEPAPPEDRPRTSGVPAGHVPVVDVTAEEGGAVESERDREARIDEMERALDSFGRRRTPDYGRRGRRR
jgi:hypothetical protein